MLILRMASDMARQDTKLKPTANCFAFRANSPQPANTTSNGPLGCRLLGCQEQCGAHAGKQYLTGTADPVSKANHPITPCFSTGMWFAHPRPATTQFFRDLLQRMLEVHVEWDQAAAQEVPTSHC